MSKTLQIILVALIGLVLLVGGFSGGFITGHFLPASNLGPVVAAPFPSSPTVSPQAQTATPQDLQTLFKPFWEAWQIIHQQYVDQPVDDTKLMEGAIRGMMESLGDPHSTYMDPQTYKDANAQLSGSYEGIGATVDPTGDFLTIVSTFPGSPAEKVGLESGDKIIAVDHKDMTGINPELVRQKVIGPAGTTVHLTVARKGNPTPLQFDVTRAKITMPSASGKMLDNGIAYVPITTFGENTTKELTAALKTLMAQHPKGLVLDLRVRQEAPHPRRTLRDALRSRLAVLPPHALQEYNGAVRRPAGVLVLTLLPRGHRPAIRRQLRLLTVRLRRPRPPDWTR